MEGALVIVIAIAAIIAYIAQSILIKKIYMKTGNYLKTGKLLPALAFLGFFVAMGVIARLVAGGDLGSVLGGEQPGLTLAAYAVLVAAMVLLFVRNIKGAGVGLGILLTVLQMICGVAIFAIWAIAMAARMFGIQLNMANSSNTVPAAWETDRAAERARWEAERAKAEAYAHHDGFDSLQDAVDAGAADPDLLN